MTNAVTLRWKQHKNNPPRLFVQTVWWAENRCRNTSFSVSQHGLVGAVECCFAARARAGAYLPPVPAYAMAYMLPLPPRA